MTKPLRYDIYRNLNKRKGNPDLFVWSVRHANGPRARLVSHHTEMTALVGVEFKSTNSTRLNAIRQNRRKVCAFVRGTLCSPSDVPSGDFVRISYNPFESNDFYRCDDRAPIAGADAVVFTPGGCFAVNPR